MASKQLPKFSDLPLNTADPPWSAWGLYGKDDEFGTLNRLTDDVVLNASKEIKTGKRISLDWALDGPKVPLFSRQPFSKNVYNKAPRCVNDDTWTFNTQCSSQWDGLRHYAYQKERRFYNGVTLDDIVGDNKTNVNGIHKFSEHGIIGRGVLLDYHAWRLKNHPEIPHEPLNIGSIKLEHLKACAEAQGTEIKFGDILIVRSGFMNAYEKASYQELEALAKRSASTPASFAQGTLPPTFIGVEQSEQVLEWVWNNFSAVAGDQPGFEAFPTQREFLMHEIFLAGWGLPIGELFHLEALSQHCHETGRFSFFLTSKPCNVPGGVASPPNIMAIF